MAELGLHCTSMYMLTHILIAELGLCVYIPTHVHVCMGNSLSHYLHSHGKLVAHWVVATMSDH